MPTIVVKYFQSGKDPETGDFLPDLLGVETFEDITEALVPSYSTTHKVFYTKRFLKSTHHLWLVNSVGLTSVPGTDIAVYEVMLSQAPTENDEYLNQTLKKDRNTTAFKLLRKGTLVEVDYGFAQDIGQSTGDVKTNKRYSDTLMRSEMHKRRLAVVIKVISKNLVQVAPVTSIQTRGDKSEFQLEQSTIDQLPRYKDSGYNSYVLCNRLQAVSTQ